MPTPKRGPRLGGGPSHQRLLMAGLATELFRHGRIRTTEARAKFLRPYAEKLITRAKKGDLAARREVLKKITDRDIVAHLFDEIAPRFAERPGGYTRILKLGPRAGDNAPMALIELVDREVESAEETIEERKRERSRGLFGRRRRKDQREEVVLPDEAYDYDQDGDELADDEQFGDDDLAGELDDVGGDEAAAEAATEDAIDAEAPEDPAPEEKHPT